MSPDYSWTLEPAVLLGVAVAGTAYALRWRRVRAEAGPGRAGAGRAALFAGGLALVLVALVSPVDALSGQLFVMHMVQHVILLDLAPILLILGLTKTLLRPVTRRIQRVESALGPLAHPFFAVLLYAGGMWLWHVPALYDAALRHEGVHVLEHVTFAWAGFLYWWHLLSPIRGRHRLAGLGPIPYMCSTKLLVGLLGVLLTFAPSLLYDFYAGKPHYWGLAPLTDQNVGGALMALEQSIVMGTALIGLFFAALEEAELRELREERFGAA